MNNETYTNTLQDLSDFITNKPSAPYTGYYYSQVYDSDTYTNDMPVLNVELRKQQLNNPNIANTLQNYNQDSFITNKNYDSAIYGNYTVQQSYSNQSDPVPTTPNDAEFPLTGVFMLLLLLSVVGFVYFIIRVWQDHQSQKFVMNGIGHDFSTKKHNPQSDNSSDTRVESHKHEREKEYIQTKKNINLENGKAYPPTDSTAEKSEWRVELQNALHKLDNLLTEKKLQGDTIADKLKMLKPGQFAFADVAWEAQHRANNLLKSHDSEIDEYSVRSTLQLFEQVFEKNSRQS